MTKKTYFILQKNPDPHELMPKEMHDENVTQLQQQRKKKRSEEKDVAGVRAIARAGMQAMNKR